MDPNARVWRGAVVFFSLAAACSTDVSRGPISSAPVEGAEPGPPGEEPELNDSGPPLGSAQPPVFVDATSPRAVPITGGTLLVASDGTTAVASDPDRDVVYVASIDGQDTMATIPLTAGDEPGRLVEDGGKRVHVALRRGGGIVTIDLASRAIVARRAVCPAPRGVAYVASTDSVVVACATGELVSFPASGGDATRTAQLGRDLRDVVATPEGFLVSRFRSGDILHVDPSFAITSVERLAAVDMPGGVIVGGLKDLGTMTPSVAWRMIARPDGGAFVLHQRGRTSLLETTPGGYGGSIPCGAAVHGTITVVGGGFATQTPAIENAVVPVDVAVGPGGNLLVVSAGNAHTPQLPTLLSVAAASGGGNPCITPRGQHPQGQPVAVAYAKDGRYVVQSREPANLLVYAPVDQTDTFETAIPTRSLVPAGPPVTREDTGHAIFHSNAGSSLACASCHPEAGDDGRSWRFSFGPRRTPSLRGTLSGTAPYHWGGDEHDIAQLSRDVFSGRMAGPVLDPSQTSALQTWLFGVFAPPVAQVDGAARARGQALFESATAACASCHSGAMKTNNATVDVGTGGAFQVPSLVGVGWHAPFLHDGCAATLADRFGTCATPGHGATAQLSEAEKADLGTYLESL